MTFESIIISFTLFTSRAGPGSRSGVCTAGDGAWLYSAGMCVVVRSIRDLIAGGFYLPQSVKCIHKQWSATVRSATLYWLVGEARMRGRHNAKAVDVRCKSRLQVAAFTEGTRCLSVRAKVQNRGSQEEAYSA